MSAEPTFPAELAAVAESVVRALARVQSAAGADVASHAAEITIRLAVHHLLTAHGPVAARRALIATYADLQAETEAANSGSLALQ